jgi:hypothetical protein
MPTYSAKAPSYTTTPDVVNTRIGTLRSFDGLPDPETVQKVYDNSRGLRIQALCPGIVATEFHERQGIDLSALPRMSAEDVVTASLRVLMLGEVVCAPGVERRDLLDAALESALAAFSAQSPHLAGRYRS